MAGEVSDATIDQIAESAIMASLLYIENSGRKNRLPPDSISWHTRYGVENSQMKLNFNQILSMALLKG